MSKCPMSRRLTSARLRAALASSKSQWTFRMAIVGAWCKIDGVIPGRSLPISRPELKIVSVRGSLIARYETFSRDAANRCIERGLYSHRCSGDRLQLAASALDPARPCRTLLRALRSFDRSHCMVEQASRSAVRTLYRSIGHRRSAHYLHGNADFQNACMG